MFLENLFGNKFPKYKPKDLINPKTGKRLELDGYCTDLKIAFEHNSKFHIGNEERDLVKHSYCKSKGIKLLVTNDLFNEVKRVDLLNYLLDELSKSGIVVDKESFFKTKFEWVINLGASKWTSKSLKALCEKYKNKAHFIEEQWGAYQAIARRGLLHYTKHMKTTKIPKYSDEELMEKMLEHKSFLELSRQD